MSVNTNAQLNPDKQVFNSGLASLQFIYREKLKTDIKADLKKEVYTEVYTELYEKLYRELYEKLYIEISKKIKTDIQHEAGIYHVDSPIAPLPTIPEERINHEWIQLEEESE